MTLTTTLQLQAHVIGQALKSLLALIFVSNSMGLPLPIRKSSGSEADASNEKGGNSKHISRKLNLFHILMLLHILTVCVTLDSESPCPY